MLPAPRIAHSMLHVADLDLSLQFYCKVLGMRVLRQGNMPDEGRRNAFVGYDRESISPVLELTEYANREAYDHGDAYGHLALQFADLDAACAEIEANGGALSVRPYTNPAGTVRIAFTRDPDRYEIELIQRLVPLD